MENFEFKSQICTTKEQSERLLKLGLKKETADCHWFYHNEHWGINIGLDLISCENLYPKYYIPAWSLHRLVEMIPLDIWHTEYDNSPRLKHTFWFCKHAPSYNSIENVDFRAHPNLYDNIIDCIEWLINEGYFSKDYLEERNC